MTRAEPQSTPPRAAADSAAAGCPATAPRGPFPSPLDAGAGEAAGPLPVWDLSDLYASPEDPKLAADLDQAEADGKAFAARCAGQLGAMSGDGLAEAIAAYERIEEVLGRAMSYGQLIFAGDATDPANGRFYQTLQERVTAISSHLLFFTLELNRLEDAEIERKMAGSPRSAAGSPGCATSGCSARISSPTSWKSCCTRRRSPAGPPGTGCSTRPSPACRCRSARRN